MLTPLQARAVTAVRRRGQMLVPNRPQASASEPPPPPPVVEPDPPPAAPWATHEAAEQWLDQFTHRTGIGSPLDWAPGATLAEKHAAALRLWADWTT